MDEIDQYEEVTRIEPQDLDATDGVIVTETTDAREQPAEATTQIVSVDLQLDDQDIDSEPMPEILDEPRRSSSNRKETTMDRVPKQVAKQREEGTAPGDLLPSDEQMIVVSPDPVRPDTDNHGFVLPRSPLGLSQDVTDPIADDPSEHPFRAEPTQTFAPGSKESPVESSNELLRARSESLLGRIGTRADDESDVAAAVNVEVRRPSADLLQKPSRNRMMWYWAALLGVVALALVLIAMMLSTRS